MEVAPNVHLVPGVVANAYLIVDSGGLTLIDAALPRSANKILREIQSLGFQPSDLHRIIITHADIDHVGSLEDLRRQTGAKVATSQVEAQAIRTGKPSRELRVGGVLKLLISIVQNFFKAKPSQVDEILNPGDVLPLLESLQVLATPGHTPGHISLWSPSTGILFSGDSILLNGGRFRPSQGMNNWNVEQSQASYQKQATLHPKYIFGGHGKAIDRIDEKFGGVTEPV
jgi:glyoxylase-like metal-dependent hydrolase (beta-lactamase superfamily II)